MATTTNFGWETPDDTDLVKDGALAIRTLGSAIDTSLVDLKGGTTGQVLSKTSNTDMDFTWVTSDDANAIQNAIVDAKGDLIAASAADTPARLAVGNDGETLVADSSASTGLRWQGNFAAGKNKIINGAFDIWQRGTTTNLSALTTTYLADRFSAYMDTNAGTFTYSRQTFTPGTAPVAGYEGTYFARLTTGGNCNMAYQNAIEDVRTLAGQTVTFSFWGKASTAKTLSYAVLQSFGSGGSANVTAASGSFNYTTSWQRFSITFTMPSVSGKTIGTGSYVLARMLDYQSVTGNFDVDIWGVQLEAGSVATAFQTATGTLAGELAACQRYYWRANSGSTTYMRFAQGSALSTTAAYIQINNPVPMRVVPTSVDYGGTIALYDQVTVTNISSLTLETAGFQVCNLQANVASGLTQYRYYVLTSNANNSFIGLSAEL